VRPTTTAADRPPLVDRVRLRLAQESARSGGFDTAGAESTLLSEAALVVDAGALAELSATLSAELVGAGPLEHLLGLPGITDVLVNSADEVWIDRGNGLEHAPVRFGSDASATRLAAQAGRRLDDAAPFVDAVLPDGTRLHAILPPLVLHPVISLRVLARRRLSLPDLVQLGMFSQDLADLLRAVIAARLTVLISGGTGTGKTTLLSALLAEVPASQRIITVEDAAELTIEHPHVVALLARSANAEGAGAVEMRDLVRQALRMRVDRLVVGEFRGPELVDLLAALNTGHSGGAATVHANSVRDVPARLVALAALASMTADVLAAQAASALDLVVQVERNCDGLRQVAEIALWPRASGRCTPGAEAGDVVSPVWSRSAGLGPGAAVLAGRLVAAGADLPDLLSGAR
jgi:pilus assembly protein CpaF